MNRAADIRQARRWILLAAKLADVFAILGVGLQILPVVIALSAALVDIGATAIGVGTTPDLLGLGPAINILWFILAYLSLVLMPVLMVLPIVIPLSIAWRKPAHILVLRPFQSEESARGLRRLIRRNLAKFGHTYTLSDRLLNVPWYLRWPVLLGQFAYWKFYERSIRKEKHVDRFVAATTHSIRRNINWALTLSKRFSVRCDDSLWQTLILKLLPGMDVILIDITDQKSNIVWEIEECIKLQKLKQIVFLVHESQQQAAAQWLTTQVFDHAPEQQLPIVVYNAAGPIKSDIFDEILGDRLLSRVKPKQELLAARLGVVSGAIFTSVFFWYLPTILMPERSVRKMDTFPEVYKVFETGLPFSPAWFAVTPALALAVVDASEGDIKAVAEVRLVNDFPEETFTQFMSSINDNNVFEKSNEIRVIGELGNKQAIPTLMKYVWLEPAKGHYNGTVVFCLHKLGADLVTPAIKRIRERNALGIPPAGWELDTYQHIDELAVSNHRAAMQQVLDFVAELDGTTPSEGLTKALDHLVIGDRRHRVTGGKILDLGMHFDQFISLYASLKGGKLRDLVGVWMDRWHYKEETSRQGALLTRIRKDPQFFAAMSNFLSEKPANGAPAACNNPKQELVETLLIWMKGILPFEQGSEKELFRRWKQAAERDPTIVANLLFTHRKRHAANWKWEPSKNIPFCGRDSFPWSSSDDYPVLQVCLLSRILTKKDMPVLRKQPDSHPFAQDLIDAVTHGEFLCEGVERYNVTP